MAYPLSLPQVRTVYTVAATPTLRAHACFVEDGRTVARCTLGSKADLALWTTRFVQTGMVPAACIFWQG